MARLRKGSWALIALAILAAGIGWVARAEDGEEGAGTEQCAMCHEDVVAGFSQTVHFRAPGWEWEQSCETCHGSGVAHIEEGGDPDKILRPQMMTRTESSEACLSCHASHERHFDFMQSLHKLADVGCLDCHNPHNNNEGQLIANSAELCGKCHQHVVSQFQLPRSHPLPDAEVACAGCHDPHAKSSVRIASEKFSEVCSNCHFEKAGPFLYNHDVVLVDGCVACHEVHGSPSRHLLRHETQVNLCYSCHSGSVTPGWHSAPRFLNEKCTACHTAIHGSNTNPFFLEE